MSGELPRFELLDDMGFLLSRGSGLAIRATNNRLKPLEIRARHYSVLSLACDAEGISQRELSEILGLDPSQVVGLVDDLQDKGMVDRHFDPQDRRARRVAPTPRGRAVCQQAREQVVEAREEFLAELDELERDRLADLLRRVVAGPVPPAGR